MKYIDKTDINNYLDLNDKKLIHTFEQCQECIDGRICHNSIILLKIVCAIGQVKDYLEIGVHNGGSMAMVLSEPTVRSCVGIDLFEDVYDCNKHYNISKYNTYQYFKRDNLSKHKTTENLQKIINIYKSSANIELIKGNSYFDSTENYIKGKTFDLIFIDGDHTYEGVKNDYTRFSKYLNYGGFIIFDDYHHNDIKKFVDNEVENLFFITTFKYKNSNAIQALFQKRDH